MGCFVGLSLIKECYKARWYFIAHSFWYSYHYFISTIFGEKCVVCCLNGNAANHLHYHYCYCCYCIVIVLLLLLSTLSLLLLLLLLLSLLLLLCLLLLSVYCYNYIIIIIIIIIIISSCSSSSSSISSSSSSSSINIIIIIMWMTWYIHWPLDSTMKELWRECEQFNEGFGLKFQDFIFLSTRKYRIKPYMSVMMNGIFFIKMESRCLGHMIIDNLDGNEDIKRELRSLYGRANTPFGKSNGRFFSETKISMTPSSNLHDLGGCMKYM